MLSLAAGLALAALLQPAPRLLNSGLETPGGGVAEDVAHTLLTKGAVPAGWAANQFREPFAPFECALDTSVFRSGAASARLSSEDLGAKIGLDSQQPLTPGRYRVSLWGRCEPGGKALLSISFGGEWLGPREVGDEWTECVWEGNASKTLEDVYRVLEIRAEARTKPTYWIDDIGMAPLPDLVLRYLKDGRPNPPKTLLFSYLAIDALRADAAKWSERGFGGFLIAGVMSDWQSDVWAADGDPSTVGPADGTFQALRVCNEECARYDIRNFIKVAFYTELPLWTDGAAWAKAAGNFRQCAVMARDTLCAGIGLDTEYVGQQYDLDWEGYTYQGYTQDDLHRAARLRGRQVVQAMLSEYPDMEFLTLPEGMMYYGPLWDDLFGGMLDAMVEADAPGGLHLLCEDSYDLTDYQALLQLPQRVTALVTWNQPEAVVRYWNEKCSVALGGWPLGYYRKLYDEQGERTGWGGRLEIFGDEDIGSGADRGPRFPLEKFREQMAGLSAGCRKYNWIYAHGEVWWPTPGELEVEGKTPREVEQARARRAVPNLDEYYAIVRDHYLMTAADK